MGEAREMTGRCMCGAVKFSASVTKPSVVACHCDMCRRWSAGPFMSLSCGSVTFEAEDALRIVRSSDWAERGFCSECGSNLFYRLVAGSDHQMAAGLFDEPSKLRLSLQVFTDEKLDFYDFANDTKKLTGTEVKALYAPSRD